MGKFNDWSEDLSSNSANNGSKVVTLKDVAERAGVSRSAVSRTFTSGASVSKKMRDKVEKAAKDLGYYPNLLASSLTTRRTQIIGLVSDNFVNPFFLEAFDIFTSDLQEKDLRPMLFNLSANSSPEKTAEKLRQYSVDGVIVASSTVPEKFVESLKEANIPVVYTFARYTDNIKINVVGIDNQYAGKLAAQTLIDRGYQHVGFLGGPEGARSTQDRLTGFHAVVDTHPDIDFSYCFADNYSFEAGRTAMMRQLHKNPAEAYFGADDVISIGALSAMQDEGLKVPEDIGIVGLNDMEIAGWNNINLTTIRQPIRQIVSASIDLIVKSLENPQTYPENRLFPCELIERGTLRPLPNSDESDAE